MGISYDSLEVLKRAQAKLQIAFPLLSDEGSKTIDAYGIRNKEAEGRAKGIPTTDHTEHTENETRTL